MFGWTLIKKKELAEWQRFYMTHQKAVQCHRWFSGWKDLDIIWDYLLEFPYHCSIEDARNQYAKARNTNEYGDSK